MLRYMRRIFLFFILIFELMGCVTDATPQNTMAANYNTELAIGYLQQGDFARAKAKLLLAEQQSPKNPAVQDAMAYFLERTGEPQRAAQYYQKALQLAPKSGKTQNNYGAFLCRQGQYHAAIEHFRLAVQDPNYLNPSQVYENAGLCALKIPDRKMASSFFRQALQQNPQSATALFELAKLSYNQKGSPDVSRDKS